MIMIDSKAGQRLARAKFEYHEGLAADSDDAIALRDEFMAAACAVANELIAGRHHEAEGD